MTDSTAAMGGEVTVGTLLAEHVRIMSALLDCGVIRSENQPTGDLAELVAHHMYGGRLAGNSTAGWDIQREDGTTVQVKSRRRLARSSHYGFISPNSEADLYLFVQIKADYSDIVHAYEVDGSAIERLAAPSGGRARPGSRRVAYRALDAFDGERDRTQEARKALQKIRSIKAPA